MAKAKLDAKEMIRNTWSMVCPGSPWPFVAEFKFHTERKWRFDWACERLKLAIEIEGVVYGGGMGRHQNANGMAGDCEKYNAALALGWRVVRFTPLMIRDKPDECIEAILAVAGLCSDVTNEGA